MKAAGFILLIGGFLVGAYSTALDIRDTNWTLFFPAAVVAIVGLLMLKRQARGEAKSTEVLTANKAELNSSIANIVAELDAIITSSEEISTDQIRHEIDRRLRDDLRRFADARESMVHLFGVQTYADIMSEFAAGERNINRVWSASTDGYRGEAERYLERAMARFRDARSQLDAALARA
jgi:hypothetical protein